MRFTDDQQQELADALFDAEVALLKAITTEAGRAEAFDGPRKIMQLGQALNMLRVTSGQQPFPMHWPGPMGMMMHNVSGPIEVDDDEPDIDDL